MKKISNSVKISGPKGKDKQNEKDAKMQVKASLSQIQRLSLQIDEQMTKNKYSKDNKHQKQSKTNKKEQRVDQDNEQEDSNYWPGQNKRTLNEQQTTTSKAVKELIQQYISPSWSTNNNRQEGQDNNLGNFIDIHSYQQYKKVKSSNKDFKDIVLKIQALRRHSLALNQLPQTKNESHILSLIQKILLTQAHLNVIQRDHQVLKTISKLEEIQQSLQSILQNQRDLSEHRKRIIEELKANEGSILDDMELLSNRNMKVQKQLTSIDSKNKYSHSSSEEQLQQEQQPPVPVQEQKQYQSHQTNLQQGNEDAIDYEKEYVDLMKFYQLYNPETHQIEQAFPKNKTEAMMLLNKLQTKIQQLQMKKAISLSL